MTITRERLLEIIVTGPEASGAEQNALARMALAAMDSEPVIVVGDDGGDALSYRRLIQSFEPGTKLYLHAQPAPVVSGWIPVSERLPEEGGRYWCYVEEQNSLGKSHYQWNCSWNKGAWSDKALTGRVTHWMPLPDAPQEVKK